MAVTFDEGEILDRIRDGRTLTSIAVDYETTRSNLQRWLDADEGRSARAREARIAAAAAWDEMAEHAVLEADTGIAIARARELAHHYRWRASKISPKVYGEKLDIAHSGTIDLASRIAAARQRATPTEDSDAG